ncbi:MAG: RNase P subunit p30 family protein, partial [Candidatus Bathyarchaeia archaeon]
MKRCYADLHCFAVSSDLKEAAQLISKAAELGYHLVGVPFLPSSSEEEIDKVRKLCGEWGLDLASRVDLRPKTSSELTRSLRKLRRKFEVVAALCDSKNVARQAAKDRRVDLLSFPSTDPRRRFFDLAEAELASNALASLE